MSDMNIRLLLHNLRRTWQLSGYANDRPRSFLFMAQRDELQQAILDQWAITALAAENDDTQQALTDFLEKLKALAEKSRPDEWRYLCVLHLP